MMRMQRAAIQLAPPMPTAIAAGIAVAAVTLLCLRNPTIGAHVSTSVAMLASLGTAGTAVFLTVLDPVSPARSRLVRWVRVAAVVGFAASLLAVAFAVMQVGGGLRGLGDPLARSAILRSGDYEAALARGAGLLLTAAAAGLAGSRRQRSGQARVLALAGLGLVAGSFALVGHARTHGPEALVITLMVSHVGAVALWFGGLIGLAAGLAARRTPGADSPRLLSAFAATMTGVVVMLLAGGIGLALLYIPSVAALLTTTYGQVLLIKLAVIGGVLVVSTANHRTLVPAASNGDRRALHILRMNVAVEQVALVAVLLITEVLAQQNPGG